MEIKHVSRFLIVALSANAILMLSAIFTLTIFRLRVREYKPTFPVTDEQILNRIGLATYDYLTNYMAHAESNLNSKSSSNFPKLIQADFSIYGALRGDRAIYQNSEYSIGDYIQIEKQVYLILKVDFERQRLYLRDADGAVVICVAGAPARASGRTHGTRHERTPADEEEDGTL